MSGFHRAGRAWGRGTSTPVALLALACGVALWVGGCNLHQEGVRPPDNRIFFPGGATIQSTGSGTGRWLYVVNSNSDLRYNSGTVVAVDLHAVRSDYEQALIPNDDGSPRRAGCGPDTRKVPRANVSEADRCCWDYLDSNILNCDEQIYIRRESSVRIGSFGGRPVTQELPNTSEITRMFVPVRGDVAIDMFEVTATADEAAFRCTGPRARGDGEAASAQERFATCDANWRITRAFDPLTTTGADPLPDDQVLRLPAEPYALAVDQGLALMYVGHLRGGGVSMIDLGCGDEEITPTLLQVFPGLLPGDANGSQGITSLAIKNRKGLLGPVYATSRYSPVVGSFVVYGVDTSCNSGTDLGTRAISIVGTGQSLSTGLSGAETRGIEFIRTETEDGAGNPAPDRAFILQRTPPALVGIDLTTLAPFATVEVCQSPTNLVQQVDESGRTVALFVTCFDSGEVYVIDPWTPRLRSVIPVGRGPITTILPPAGAPRADAQRAYVVGFGANNVAVVDLDPTSPTQYRIVQRIGFPSTTPREVGPQ